MDAQDNQSMRALERIRKILSTWFATKRAISVTFREVINPTPDADARYTVAYEAIFEPLSLDQARVELWVTSEGNIGIGFESHKRVAERLGVSSRYDRFATGHEPHRMSETSLLALLDLIADGKIAISCTVIPLKGLISTKALLLSDCLDQLVLKDYSPLNWLHGVSQSEFSNQGNLLKYRQWDN